MWSDHETPISRRSPVKQHFDTHADPVAEQLKTTVDGDHGRIETRTYKIFPSDSAPDLREWPGLKTIVKVESRREIGDKVTSESRYYITSLELNVDKIARAIRGHWSVENSLHWVLDVQMGEDLSRIRTVHAAENIARLRRLSINMLKQHEPRKKKTSIQKKRMSCILSNDYLMKVLKGAD